MFARRLDSRTGQSFVGKADISGLARFGVSSSPDGRAVANGDKGHRRALRQWLVMCDPDGDGCHHYTKGGKGGAVGVEQKQQLKKT